MLGTIIAAAFGLGLIIASIFWSIEKEPPGNPLCEIQFNKRRTIVGFTVTALYTIAFMLFAHV